MLLGGRSKRTRRTAPARVALLLQPLLWFGLASRMEAGIAEGHLLLDGQDVTGRYDGQIVFVEDTGSDQSAKPSEIQCKPGIACTVPKGVYWITLRSDQLVALGVGKLIADLPEPAKPPHVFFMQVARAAWLEVAKDRFVTGYRVDALDVGSGRFFQEPVGPGSSSFQVPARPIVLALVDPALKTIGILPPLTLKPDQRQPLPEFPRLAKGRGQLLCILALPPAARGAKDALTLSPHGGGKKIPPDLEVTSDPYHRYSFWFDVPSGRATIVLDSREWMPEKPLEPEIPNQGALSLTVPLVHKPFLKVSFGRPERVPAGSVEIELLDCRRSADVPGPIRLSLCTEAAAASGASERQFAFTNLEPSFYALRWRLGGLRDVIPFDMRDGKSIEETIPIRAYEMTGFVRKGNEPLSATLRWRHFATGETYETKADESGSYRILLSQRDDFLVQVDAEESPGFSDIVLVSGDAEQDFQIPTNRTRVRVIDRDSLSPIVGARVAYGLEPSSSRLSRAAQVLTDSGGEALLPPFQEGRVEVYASAEGYRSEPPREMDVTNKTVETFLELRLERSSAKTISVLEPDGRPAEGARLTWGQTIVSKPADSAGIVQIDEPTASGEPLVVADSSGRIGVFRFTDEREQQVRMPLPGAPFLVDFRSADGRPLPVRGLQYSLDGVLIPQPIDYLARQAAGGDVTSKLDGTVVVAGLPARGILSVWPFGAPELAITTELPVAQTLHFSVPD